MPATTPVAVRKRLRNVDELAAVVRMMKALSAAGVVQFEQAAQAAVAYRAATEQALALAARAGLLDVPDAAGSRGVVVFGTDQGLVGQFNEHLRECLLGAMTQTGAAPRLWVVGRRLADLLGDELAVTASFDAPQSPAAAANLVSKLLAAIGGSACDHVELVANLPTTRPHYLTHCLPFLPVSAASVRDVAARAWPRRGVTPQLIARGADSGHALFEEYRFVALHATCMQSCLAEHRARLAAMQRAEKNIVERRQTLEGLYNRLRQDTVDAELFDLVAGFEALVPATPAPA